MLDCRREKVGWGGEAIRRRNRSKGQDSRLNTENGSRVGGGARGGDGLGEDLKDFGPLIRTHPSKRRAGDRGCGRLEGNRGDRGVRLGAHPSGRAGDRGVRLARGNKGGSVGKGSSRVI